MRIAIGGIIHESNTFCKLLTTRQDFETGGLAFGSEMLSIWQDSQHELGGFISAASAFAYEILPTVMATAAPAGMVEDTFLEEWLEKVLAACQKEPIDGMLIALHGAMVSPKHASADTEIVRRLRETLGLALPIAVTLDFHAHATPAMAEYADIIIGSQTYPHIDQRIRGILAAELLVHTINHEIRPVSVVVQAPMLVNLLGQATDREPMRELVSRARILERQDGMLSVSLLAGSPYADVPNAGLSVVAVADGKPGLARAVADSLCELAWNVRAELCVPALATREAVSFALASDRTPVVLVDLGDNIAAGAPGDGTALLKEMLLQHATASIAVIHSPAAARAAFSLGVGKFFNGLIGGVQDPADARPLHIWGTVQALHHGKWEDPESRFGMRFSHDQGLTAVLSIEGGNLVVLNSKPTPPVSLGQLTSLGLDVRLARIVVVKAAVDYKPAYTPIAGRIIEADTPGITPIDPHRLAYQNLRRPIYPVDV